MLLARYYISIKIIEIFLYIYIFYHQLKSQGTREKQQFYENDIFTQFIFISQHRHIVIIIIIESYYIIISKKKPIIIFKKMNKENKEFFATKSSSTKGMRDSSVNSDKTIDRKSVVLKKI